MKQLEKYTDTNNKLFIKVFFLMVKKLNQT